MIQLYGRWLAATVGVYMLITGCRTNKNLTYFRDISDTAYISSQTRKLALFNDPVIQAKDILQVTILTLDPDDNKALAVNAEQPQQYGVGNEPSVPGFQVDQDGMVELPIIGKIKLAGLTTAQARDTVHNRVAKYYNSPVVNVRFSNFTITVLGEVAKPGIFRVPNEKINIMDAIGLAGDLTIYGKRENVMLMRDSLGEKKIVRLDMRSSATLSSPYFYLRQGDIIYVEPGKWI